MKLAIPQGTTNYILTVFIQDSSSVLGAGLAGLTEASSIVGGFVRAGGVGVALAVDENVTTEGTYQAPSAAGKVRIGTPANMRAGTYELHFHNDLFAAGADYVVVTLGGAVNMADIAIEVQLLNPTQGLAGTYLDVAVSSRSSHSAADVATQIGNGAALTEAGGTGDQFTAITTKTDNLPTDPADHSLIIAATDAIIAAIGNLNNLDAAAIRAAVGLAAANLDTQLGTLTTRLPGIVQPQTGDAYARLATYRLGELIAIALASSPVAGSLFADLTEDNAGTQRFTSAALINAPGGTEGPGSTQHTLSFGPLASYADVWIKDSGGTVIASGSADGNGDFTVWLDAGSYNAFMQKAGINFSNPQAFTVA